MYRMGWIRTEKIFGLPALPLHCKKKIKDFPVPSQDVTNQTLSGRE
jgi:hypothetical protein